MLGGETPRQLVHRDGSTCLWSRGVNGTSYTVYCRRCLRHHDCAVQSMREVVVLASSGRLCSIGGSFTVALPVSIFVHTSVVHLAPNLIGSRVECRAPILPHPAPSLSAVSFSLYLSTGDLPAIKCATCEGLVEFVYERVAVMREEAPFKKVCACWYSSERACGKW